MMRIIALAMLICSNVVSAEAIPGSDLFVSAEISSVRLSPDGSLLTAYVLDEDGRRRIELMDLDKHQFLSSINVNDSAVLEEYYWLNLDTIYFKTNNASRSASSAQIGKIINGEIKLSKLKTPGYLVDHLPDTVGKVMFAKKEKEFHSLYVVSIEGIINNDFSGAKKIEHNDKAINYYAYDDNFKRIISAKLIDSDEALVFQYIPFEGGNWQPLARFNDLDFNFQFVGFRGQNVLAVLTNENSDKILLREYDTLSGSFGEIIYEHPDYDLVDAELSSGGELESVSYYDHGVYQFEYFDTVQARLFNRLKKTFKNQQVLVADSVAGDVSVLYVNGSTQPGEFFLYNHKTDVVKRLLAEYSGLVNYNFSPSQLLKSRARDGAVIEAFLTEPVSGLNHRTLLVMPHGGPVGVREYDNFNREVQYFVSRGFSVLRVNFRGSSGYGKSFLERGVGEFGQLIESDITSVVNRVLSTNRFRYACAIGRSYGGYSSTMLAIMHPNVYKCVVGGYGVYDLPLMYNASNYRSGKEFEEAIAVTLGEYTKELVNVSPVYQYKKLSAPILLVAGRNDDIADFEHSNRFKYLLEKAGHNVEAMFYRDTGHGHKTWDATHHEVAIISDYLMRTLNLQYPAPSSLSENAKRAYMEDFVVIGHGYHYDDIVDNDADKAQLYYNQGAYYGYKPK